MGFLKAYLRVLFTAVLEISLSGSQILGINICIDVISQRSPGTERGSLDNSDDYSTFVLMEVETLGIARSLGWRVHMRCARRL